MRAGVAAFLLGGIGVVAISVGLQMRQQAQRTAALGPKFSGSTIVADLPSILPRAWLSEQVRVAVVRDSAGASYYDSSRTLDSIVALWRNELSAVGASVVSNASNADVIVIPSAPCMTLKTRELIEAAASRGQGLIITGPAATYDAGCRRIGYGLIVSASNAARVERLEQRAMVYVVLPAGTPLSADMPPGARIELNPARQIALRHPARDGYYADYALQPQPAGRLPLLDGAIARHTRGNARIVYWGFELEDVYPRDWNRAVVRLLVRNSVAWAGRWPQAWIEPWPRGDKAAAALAQDVEYQFPNVRFAADSLHAAGIPSTYFLTSRYATHYKRLTRELAKVGEIGSHTESHMRLGGVAAHVQRSRLRKTQRHLAKFVKGPVAGLRPPEEQFDVATMSAWLDVGGSYLMGVNDRRAAAPELLQVGKDTLVLLSRVVDDDLALSLPGRLPDTKLVETKFMRDLTQMRALGGLYLLSYHSQLLARPELVNVVVRVARAAAADTNTWIATTGEIARWWRAREQLRVYTRSSSTRA
jgi:peptidoglycan/xylan/chitin deacetylase (PgdA/CDA1 family)